MRSRLKVLQDLALSLLEEARPAWRAFRRRPPALQRAAVYGIAAALVWAGWMWHGRLRTEASTAEFAVSEGSVLASGELGGDRLRKGLLDAGFSKKDADAAIKTLKKVGGPGRHEIGDSYRIVRSTAGEFLHLTLLRSSEKVVLRRDGKGGFKAVVSEMPVQISTFHSKGKITSSLWLSMTRQGVPDEVIQEFTDVFQWTIDFLTETRDGDRFAVTWTELRRPDGRLRDRTIEAAFYDGRASGRNTGLRFAGFYYDENGEALERVFLRAPLNYRRISSTFSTGRFHPILRKVRPHHGTDYSAPYGTPVVAVGDGLVTETGWKGGLGKQIEVKHGPVYTTVYGHLSRYAAGIGPGVRVKQGQLIGYVGSTGLATGPHLHFQIAKHGSWVNFMKLNLPRARAVAKDRMAEFAALRDRWMGAWEEEVLLSSNGSSAR